MSSGYAIPFYKRASAANFDGSATLKTLWIKAQAISGIYISTGKLVDETAAGRGYYSCILEYFSGASWTGSAWSGGSWNELWHSHLVLYWGATATKDSNTPQTWQAIFEPAMIIPPPYKSTIQDPTVTGISRITPNTHNATPTAGETDVRLYFSNDAGSTTAIEFMANVLVPM